MAESTTWRNRIAESGTADPQTLLANPKNWRIHPKEQQDALAGVLTEVGWVQDVIVNKRTGHVIDGHLRVSLALRQSESKIPVKYVDLEPHEEDLILATFDPISALAGTDATMLESLMHDVTASEASVQQLLASVAEDSGILGDLSQSQLDQSLDDLIDDGETPATTSYVTITFRLTGEEYTNKITEVEQAVELIGVTPHIQELAA